MKGPLVHRAYVELAGGQIHLRLCGSGYPLLLLHQSPSSGTMWEPIMPALANAGFLALAPDMPGFGASAPFARPPSVDDYADAMWRLTQAVGWARFGIVGHHTGAAVGLRMAADQPDRIARMALWGIPLLDEALVDRLRAEQVHEFDDDGHELARLWARRRALAGPDYTPGLGVARMVELLQCASTQPWAHWAVAATDMPTLLRAIACPVLALCGRRDPAWPRAAEAARMLRDGRFHEIGDAGLDVVDGHTREFCAVILDFLRPLLSTARDTGTRSPRLS